MVDTLPAPATIVVVNKYDSDTQFMTSKLWLHM